jgi:hypothetical protein
MTYKNLSFLIINALFLVQCTGEKKPNNTHEAPKGETVATVTPVAAIKSEVDIINEITDENERLKQTETFISSKWAGVEQKVKYSTAFQDMITFAVRKWSAVGKTDMFTKLVNNLFLDEDMDSRYITSLENSETRKLIYKAGNESKDAVLKFKLVVLLKKISRVKLTDEDLLFMQQQIAWIKKETNFSFIEGSEPWIRTNRDLIQILMSSDIAAQIKFNEKEFEGANINRAQREKVLLSLFKLKKSILPIMTPESAKLVASYKADFERLKKELPIFTVRAGVNEIKNENDVALVVALLNSDLDITHIEKLIQEGALDKGKFSEVISDWINFEIAQVVRKYKEEFLQFQDKKKNYLPKFYFPEMKKALVASQLASREKVSKLKIFSPVAKSLGAAAILSKIADLDIFFKRFLNSNTTLLILRLFAENELEFTQDVVINNAVIKRERADKVKENITRPNVLAVSEGFYLGEIADQFEFSVNDRMSQKFETLDGIQQGIKLGLFSELNFNELEVMKTFFNWISQSRLVQIDTLRAGQGQEAKVFKLQQNLNLKLNSSYWQTFKEHCASWKANESISRDLDLSDIKASLLIGKASRSIELSATTRESGGSSDAISLFPYNGEQTKALEFLRTDTSYVVIYFETIMDILKENGSDVASLDSLVKGFKGHFTLFLKDYISFVSDFDDCYFLKRKKEQELINKVFAYENLYWKFILSKVSGPKKVLLSNVLPMSYSLPEGITYRSYYENSQIVINQVDFYFRVKQYLEFGLQLGNEKMPPLDPQATVKFSAKLSTQAEYTNSKFIPVIIQNGSTTSSVISAHDFSGSTFVEWFALSNLEPFKFNAQLDTLYILHRMGSSLKDIFDVDAEITLEHLTKTYFSVFTSFHINDEFKTTLKHVGLPEIAPIGVMLINGFFLKEKELAFPFYDYLFISMSSPFIGYYSGGVSLMLDTKEGQSFVRPIQLLSTDYILATIYRYYDDSYVGPFRAGKMAFPRYLNRLNQEMNTLKKLSEYADHVYKTRNGQGYSIRLRTTTELPVPLYSEGAKNNLNAVVAVMKKNLDAIEAVKAGAR